MSGRIVTGPRSLDPKQKVDTSPLKVFGQAKKQINDVYIQLADHIEEGNAFVKELSEQGELVTHEQSREFFKYTLKVARIREVLTRDRMKVAFFGRTSNGKSSVINAMLRKKILPSGIGHITNCFLQVEGTEESEAFMIKELEGKEPENMGLQSISQLANALSKVKVNNDTMIRVCWPQDMCTLLRDDVVFVDSPGVDVSPDLDAWIDKFCLDADVFVLVANAESTLMQTEKNFFHRVSERISKPNIFILNNRWDASANEPETIQEVKQQHMERSMEFLVEELGVCTAKEAQDRVFFVSAREALVSRTNEDKGTPTPTGQLLEGFQGRLFEFANFERKFEECISQSAVETKFALHAYNGKDITKYMHKLMDHICISSVDTIMLMKQQHGAQQQQLASMDKQMTVFKEDMKHKIRKMTSEVKESVGQALDEEIRRLHLLVNQFNLPFNCVPYALQEYKKSLQQHIEVGLSSNLRNTCSQALMSVVECMNQDMTESLSNLVGGEAVAGGGEDSFRMNYIIDCRDICAGFQEDINFRFSLGITMLMKKFMWSKSAGKRPLQVPAAASPTQSSIPRPLPPPCSSGRGVGQRLQGGDGVGEEGSLERELLMSLFTNVSSIYSGTSLGVLAIMCIVGKAAGWKVLGLCGGIYGGLYAYERISWTNGAKEKTFKRQFVDYATSNLRCIVGTTSAHCSSQVEQELNRTLASLCSVVNNSRSDLQLSLQELQRRMDQVDEASKTSNNLKNKVQFVDDQLNNFISQYIQTGSKI